MTDSNATIGANMNHIRELFTVVPEFVEANRQHPEKILSFLESEPPEFRSIAYEAASFMIGYLDLKEFQDLHNWAEFYEAAYEQHPFHVEIGLGWSFAKAEILPQLPFKYGTKMVPSLSMIYDGIGYYFALFRGRRTLKSQQLPESFPSELRASFDQGVGRRIWYVTQGNIEKTVSWTEQFNEERQPDLWRGIGIAFGYVGGFTETELEKLKHIKHLPQLAVGLALATLSRFKSDAMTPSISSACQSLTGRSAAEVCNQLSSFMKTHSSNLQHDYNQFVTKLLGN